jgi:hypothetical protein
MRVRRRHTAWLAVLATLVMLVTLSGTASAPVTAALLSLFAVALVASIIEFQPKRLLENVSSSPLAMMRMSPQAREAVERARRRTAYAPPGLNLLDVGLISLQSSTDGMVMRRSRMVSLDESGVRPYITLHIDPSEADRNAVVRFEILDQNGTVQYIHEMKTYLRDGEMNILADHQLPLAGNERLAGAGDWDLRVSIDGTLLGLLTFTTTPSINNRNRQFIQAANDAAYRLSDESAEESPTTLQDLLRAANKDRSERR